MKKILFFLSFMISLSFFTSCNPEEEAGLYTVEGFIKDKNGVIKDVKISVDNAVNWTTTTSSDGYFKIENISQGVHNLQVTRVNADTSFTDLSYKLDIVSDINLQSLLLPSPLKLLNPKIVDNSSISISWNKTDGDDFYEYKLYRHNSPGLDETTGELIYVSTSMSDTTFIDSTFTSDQKCYYRVFLMNKVGKIGGSNIVALKTPALAFMDGDFESGNYNKYWIKHGTKEYICNIDSVIKYQGKYSFYANGYFTSSLEAALKSKPFNLERNTTYTISFMAKHNGQRKALQYFSLFVYQDDKVVSYFHASPPIDSNGNVDNSVRDVNWTPYHSYFTTTDKNSSYYIDWGFTVENIWIDDIQIKKSY